MKIPNKLYCLFLGHKDGEKQSCPFTGRTYTLCARCEETFKSEPTEV